MPIEAIRAEGRSTRYGLSFLLLGAASLALVALDPRTLGPLGWPAVSWTLLGTAYLWPGLGIVTKQGPRLGLASKLALLPHLGLMYAVWHLVRLGSKEPAFARLTDDLIIGRRLLASEYPTVTTVVDLAAEMDERLPASAIHLASPILDGAPLTPDRLRDLARRIAGLQGPIYLHCAQGHGRTAMVAAAVLLERGLAGSPAEALRLIREARPGARPNRAQTRALDRAYAGLAQRL